MRPVIVLIENFLLHPTVMPDLTVVRDVITQYTYAKIGNSVFDKFLEREILQEKNRVLRSTPDLLLPKLVSGEIDVSGLDIDLGEEV